MVSLLKTVIHVFYMNIQGSSTKHGENEEVDDPETPSQVTFEKMPQMLCFIPMSPNQSLAKIVNVGEADKRK